MREQRGEHPVDLLIGGFTLVGVMLLVSEKCRVPAAGMILQAAALPTADPAADGRLFGSQTSRKSIKATFENFPLAAHSLPNMRAAYSLPWKATWPTVFEQGIPMVLPMHPSTFSRPADWGPNIKLTDFIFLRPRDKKSAKPLAPELQSFITNAREAKRKLMVMTFSSMPVPRRSMLRVAVRMLRESRHPISLIYVGKRQGGNSASLSADAAELSAAGKFIEVEAADFGVLFPQLDAFIVHGGLGTTVEALRTCKPVAVTGILLMDQRFWADVVHKLGVGPTPVFIDKFSQTCVHFADEALDPSSEWAKTAAKLTIGTPGDDGIQANVTQFAKLLEGGLQPVQ